MTLLEAIAQAERTGEAFEHPYTGRDGPGSASLCLGYDKRLRHFYESKRKACDCDRRDGPCIFHGSTGCSERCGLLINVEQLRSDLWQMRPAPDLSNIWRPR